MTNKKLDIQLAGEFAALQDFFAYNTFVRKKYLSAIIKLPKKTLTKDRGASYPTILDILTHILDVIVAGSMRVKRVKRASDGYTNMKLVRSCLPS